MPSKPSPPPDELSKAIAALRDDAEVAALRLSGDDIEADIQELAEVLKVLEEHCEAVGKTARGKWKARLLEARRHFHEARDLLDDGEPADAVALEVMAGREGLRN